MLPFKRGPSPGEHARNGFKRQRLSSSLDVIVGDDNEDCCYGMVSRRLNGVVGVDPVFEQNILDL